MKTMIIIVAPPNFRAMEIVRVDDDGARYWALKDKGETLGRYSTLAKAQEAFKKPPKKKPAPAKSKSKTKTDEPSK